MTMEDQKCVQSEAKVAEITWNCISEDGLLGWVSSTKDAENIRRVFEAESGMKFITERKWGMWRTDNGKDWDEDLRFYVKKSKSGKLEGKDGDLAKEEEMAVDHLEQTENQEGSLSNSGTEDKVMAHKIRFTDTIAKDAAIPSDGVPFCTVARFVCSCVYGKARHSREKQKMTREMKDQQRFLEEGIPVPKRRKSGGTKKVCCPALLSMKKVIRFPEYKVNEPTPRRLRDMSERVRMMMLAEMEMEKEVRVYIKLPTEEDHGNHELAKVPKKLKKKLCKYNPYSRTATLDDLEKAYRVVQESDLCVRTPMLHHAQALLRLDVECDLSLKLENMQKTGSFKVRGLANQLARIVSYFPKTAPEIVTMSAGNYGKAFSFALHQLGLKARVLMPDTAPQVREDIMRGYGAEVERLPSSELQPTIDRYVSDHGMHFLHPFDDIQLICGHGSTGFEILEEVPDPDVVVVCCGGGGLLAGIAAAVKLSGKSHARIYGVEPEEACLMHLSKKHGKVVKDSSAHSIASGLAPPYAGSNAYCHVAKYVDDILLLSEAEIIAAVSHLYHAGLVVEPAGAAAFGALLFGKVPDIKDKKVVVVITGGNVSPEELCSIVQTAS